MRNIIKVILPLGILKVILKEFIILGLLGSTALIYIFYGFEICKPILVVGVIMFFVYVGLLIVMCQALDWLNDSIPERVALTGGDNYDEED